MNYLKPSAGIFLLLLLSSAVTGQQKKWDPLFPVDDVNFRLSGWYGGAGATYTFSLPSTIENNYELGAGTSVNAQFKPGGKVGFVVEGGRYTMTYSKIIPYIDYGITFKMIGGTQDYTEYRLAADGTDTISTGTSFASFNNYYISVHFNANNAIRISEYGFIQNTIGLNIDYKAIESMEGTAPVFPDTKINAEEFLVQLHYKLGYGLRLDKKHFLIFSLETPVLTAYPWDNGKSTIALFNLRYRPVMLSVKLLFLRNKTRPPCNKPTDINTDKKRRKTRMF